MGLLPQETISMRTYVDDLIPTPRNAQLLVALRDGKVVVVAPTLPTGPQERRSFSSHSSYPSY